MYITLYFFQGITARNLKQKKIEFKKTGTFRNWFEIDLCGNPPG